MILPGLPEGDVVQLSPSCLLSVGGTDHAFGWDGYVWRISSKAIEYGEDNTWIRTRSRIYVLGGKTKEFDNQAHDQLMEFLITWRYSLIESRKIILDNGLILKCNFGEPGVSWHELV